MKTFVLNFLSIIFLTCSTTIILGQSYSINGDLGIDTVPQHKLDVNGDGRFKGELLLDDDLQMRRLISNDTLLRRLIYVEKNGRMQRLDTLVADMVAAIHNFSCISDVGQDPVVFWNSEPGKIYAYSEQCNFTPDVGIGTKFPEARLHVRGSSYFAGTMGIGLRNESATRFQISSSAGNKALEVLKNTFEEGVWVNKPVFHVRGDGTTKLYNIPKTANALSLRNEEDIDTDVFSLFGNGGIRLIMEPSEETRALWIRNNANENAFELKSNGQMMLQGMGLGNHALTIRGEVDGSTGFSVKGNGYIEQRVAGSGNDAAIRIVDTEPTDEIEVFKIQKNGEIKVQQLLPEDNVLTARNNETAVDEWNVVIGADGSMYLKGSENDETAFSIRNSDSHETFNIRGKGQVTIDRSDDTGDYPTGLRIYTPENSGFKVIDVSHSGLSAPIFRLWGDGKIEQNFDGIDNSKAIQLKNLSLSGDQDVFTVWENGVLRLNYAGSDPSSVVFRIENENLDEDIFHIKGDGHISAAAVHVRELGNFPDYVFEPAYELMSLEKLRAHIAQHQCLPNMPSADEVARNGLDLGEMNRLLVEKVEELTLYVLDLEERLKTIESK